MVNTVKRITFTGSAGQIGYAILFRIANGDLLDKNQPITLQLLELPQAQSALKGVVMELEDCAFPLLHDITVSDDPKIAFKDTDYAFLIGSKPRGKGMERKDLLSGNAEIFKVQGRALNEVASRDVHVLVVGNPANTNAYITIKSAPDLPKQNFSSMMRLDHNRGVAHLAKKLTEIAPNSYKLSDIDCFIVWGNHSSTMHPDYSHVTVAQQKLSSLINDENWYSQVFIPTIAKRGTAIIDARGSSSAASAANAAIDQMRDWVHGSQGRWVTMGIASDGSYGIDPDIVYGMPVTTTKGGHYHLVTGLDISPFIRNRMEQTLNELREERDSIAYLLSR